MCKSGAGRVILIFPVRENQTAATCIWFKMWREEQEDTQTCEIAQDELYKARYDDTSCIEDLKRTVLSAMDRSKHVKVYDKI